MINKLMFVYIRSTAFVIVVTQKLVLQQSKNVTAKTYRPLLVFYSPSPSVYFIQVSNLHVEYSLFVCPIITQQPLDRFALDFDWGTR